MDGIGSLLEREVVEHGLQAVLDQARAGRGRLVIVEGAAGTGISSLLDRTAEVASGEGLVVLRARAAGARGSALLAPVLGSLGAHLDGVRAVERERLLHGLGGIDAILQGRVDAAPAPLAESALFEAIARLAGRIGAGRGLLWVIDDVQRADPASLAMLLHLSGRSAPRGVVVVVGLHPSNAAAIAELRRAVQAAEHGLVLEVGPLTDHAIAELARRVRPELDTDAVEAVVAGSGGIPLLAWALATADGKDGETVAAHGVLDDALADASDGGRAVFELIAIAGAEVPHVALARVDPEWDVDEICADLRRRGLIVPIETTTGWSYRVTAPALAAAASGVLEPGRRQRAHAALAASLETVPDISAEALAPHYRVAAQLLPIGRTLDVLTEAAREARGRGAFVTAIPNLEAAIAIAGATGASGRLPELLAALADSYYRTGRPEESAGAYRRLLAIVDDDDPMAESARLTLAIIRSDLDGARVHLTHSPRVQPGSRAEQAVLQLFVIDRYAEPEKVRAVGERLRAFDGPSATLEERAAASLGSAVVAAVEGDPLTARARCEDALTLVADGPHEVILGAAASELSRLCITLGDLDAADSAVRVSLEMLRRNGPLGAEASMRSLSALVHLLRGELREARVVADRGLALARRTAAPRIMIRGLAVVALLDATQSRPREATANLSEAQRIGASGFTEPRVMTLLDCVHAELALLDPTHAWAIPNRALFRVDGVVQLWYPTLVGRLALATGRQDDAARETAKLRDLGRWSGAASALADRLDGLGRLATGDPRGAAELLGSAAERLTVAGMILPARQAHLERAEAVATIGEHTSRDELLGLVAYFDEQDIRSWSDRARRAARAHNVRVAARSGTGERLTPRESEVAELVGAGRSNAEIAAALFLSERTVETHLRHVYERLGLSSRTALVRYLTEREHSDARD